LLKINNKNEIIKVWLITKVKFREIVVTLTDNLHGVITISVTICFRTQQREIIT